MLSILNSIAEAKGAQKLAVMESVKGMNPNTLAEFKRILKLAYDPYVKFGIQSTTYPDDIPPAVTYDVFALALGFLEDGNFNVADLRLMLASRDPDQREVIKRIVLKDLRCGINVKSINKVFPGLIPTFDVMLAQKVVWSRVRYPCWSDIKLDGVRCLVTHAGIFTRSGREIIGCDHIFEQCNVHGISPGVAIDGELMVKGLGFDAGSGKIRSHADTPDAVFYFFDVAYLDGRPQLPYADRIASLHRNLTRLPNLFPCPRRYVESEEQAREHYYQARKEGHEGTILKPLDYTYEAKRSYSWMKVKPKIEEDLECVGFYEGEGRFEGTLGGIIVDFGGVEVRVGGGFSDQERDEIWDNQDKYLHETAEVYGQERTAAGSIRHPQFKKWRHDK